jgi:uridine kinase
MNKKIKPIFIGITGGSGAGKSTLCDTLIKKYPNKIESIRLDDYFKPKEEQPKVGDILNFEHPDSLYFDKLADDLKELSKGNSVVINTKNTHLNPEYEKTKIKMPCEFKSKPIILVEGFLVLSNEKIRSILNESIYLDVEHDKRWARRVHFKNEEYEKKVIIPMHNEHIEPTKKYASHIIDVSNLSKEEVLKKVEEILNL